MKCWNWTQPEPLHLWNPYIAAVWVVPAWAYPVLPKWGCMAWCLCTANRPCSGPSRTGTEQASWNCTHNISSMTWKQCSPENVWKIMFCGFQLCVHTQKSGSFLLFEHSLQRYHTCLCSVCILEAIAFFTLSNLYACRIPYSDFQITEWRLTTWWPSFSPSLSHSLNFWNGFQWLGNSQGVLLMTDETVK